MYAHTTDNPMVERYIITLHLMYSMSLIVKNTQLKKKDRFMVIEDYYFL